MTTIPKPLADWLVRFPNFPKLLLANPEVNNDRDKLYKVLHRLYTLADCRISLLNRVLMKPPTFLGEPIQIIEQFIFDLKATTKPPKTWEPPSG